MRQDSSETDNVKGLRVSQGKSCHCVVLAQLQKCKVTCNHALMSQNAMFFFTLSLWSNTDTILKINQPKVKFNFSCYQLTLISDSWFDLPQAMFGILTCTIDEVPEKTKKKQRKKSNYQSWSKMKSLAIYLLVLGLWECGYQISTFPSVYKLNLSIEQEFCPPQLCMSEYSLNFKED